MTTKCSDLLTALSEMVYPSQEKYFLKVLKINT